MGVRIDFTGAKIGGKVTVGGKELPTDENGYVVFGENEDITIGGQKVRFNNTSGKTEGTGHNVDDSVPEMPNEKDSDAELLEKFAKGVPISSYEDQHRKKSFLEGVIDIIRNIGRIFEQRRTTTIIESSEMPSVKACRTVREECRREDGTSYPTYNPNIEITSRNGKTEITEDGQKMTVDSRNAEGR